MSKDGRIKDVPVYGVSSCTMTKENLHPSRTSVTEVSMSVQFESLNEQGNDTDTSQGQETLLSVSDPRTTKVSQTSVYVQVYTQDVK